jgi:hypothetical protein
LMLQAHTRMQQLIENKNLKCLPEDVKFVHSKGGSGMALAF